MTEQLNSQPNNIENTPKDAPNPKEQKPIAEHSPEEQQKILEKLKNFPADKDAIKNITMKELEDVRLSLTKENINVSVEDLQAEYNKLIENKPANENVQQAPAAVEKEKTTTNTPQEKIKNEAQNLSQSISSIWGDTNKSFGDKFTATMEYIGNWFGDIFKQIKSWFSSFIPDNIKEMIGMELSPESQKMIDALEITWEKLGTYTGIGSDILLNTKDHWKQLFLKDKKFDSITLEQFKKVAKDDSIKDKKSYLKIDSKNEAIETVVDGLFSRKGWGGREYYEILKEELMKKTGKEITPEVEKTMTVKNFILTLNEQKS